MDLQRNPNTFHRQKTSNAFDVEELRAAARRLRGTPTPLNVAIYSFTDALIARVLVDEADAGTLVRVYRDGEQFEEEEHERYGKSSVTSMFQGHRNIHVRVKPLSHSELMHLKCWSDGRILRDGSANWSLAGLKRARQRNPLHHRFQASAGVQSGFRANVEQAR